MPTRRSRVRYPVLLRTASTRVTVVEETGDNGFAVLGFRAVSVGVAVLAAFFRVIG